MRQPARTETRRGTHLSGTALRLVFGGGSPEFAAPGEDGRAAARRPRAHVEDAKRGGRYPEQPLQRAARPRVKPRERAVVERLVALKALGAGDRMPGGRPVDDEGVLAIAQLGRAPARGKGGVDLDERCILAVGPWR